MNFHEYLQNHPDRLAHLDQSEEFFATAESDPIYVHKTLDLIDVYSLCATIRIHQGTGFSDELNSMSLYLKNERNLHHPADAFEHFREALDQLHDRAKITKEEYLPRKGSSRLPFFVYGTTAFGFMRHHLKGSEQLYGQPLTLASSLIPPHARKIMVDGVEKLKGVSAAAHHFAMENVYIRLRSGHIAHVDMEDEYYLDAYVSRAAMAPEHVRVALEGSAMPTLEQLCEHPEIAKLVGL